MSCGAPPVARTMSGRESLPMRLASFTLLQRPTWLAGAVTFCDDPATPHPGTGVGGLPCDVCGMCFALRVLRKRVEQKTGENRNGSPTCQGACGTYMYRGVKNEAVCH